MGLPENFLDSGKRFNKTEVFPDINTTWQRGTWQLQEMEIDWNFYEGNFKTCPCKRTAESTAECDRQGIIDNLSQDNFA